MKTKVENARQVAGGSTHVSTAQIGLLLEVAALAMWHAKEQVAVRESKAIYNRALTLFECEFGRIKGGRIDPSNPDHAQIIKATAGEYEALQRAKRRQYNVGRRLSTACRKAARINAERAS